MAYAGIVNDNEFYSEHYLADIFEGDIRGEIEAWQQRATEQGEETPWTLLRRGCPRTAVRDRGGARPGTPPGRNAACSATIASPRCWPSC
jgi:hypothetical protein